MSAAALARGRNDGTNRANAFTTELLNQDGNSQTLHVWNSFSNGAWSIEGDIDIVYTGDYPSFQSYVCFEVDSSDFWDCVAAYALGVGTEDFGVTVSDQYLASMGETVAETDDFGDSAQAWVNSNNASQACEDVEGTRRCSVTMGFNRLYSTDDAEWDIQLDRTMGEKMFDVTGYLRLLNRDSGAKNEIGSFATDVKTTLLVSAPTNDGGSGNDGGNGDGGSDNGSGDGGSGNDGGSGDGGSGDGSGVDNGSSPAPENNDHAMAQVAAMGVAVLAMATTMF